MGIVWSSKRNAYRISLAVGVEPLVDGIVERVSTGPARYSARPFELHVVEHERGIDEGPRR